MPEEKLTRKERKEALMTAALNRLDTPLEVSGVRLSVLQRDRFGD